MLSPNTPLRNHQTSEQIQESGLSTTGDPLLGTARQPLNIPVIKADANLPLRWGEWLRIAVTATLAAAVTIEAIFFMMSAIWFDDVSHALLPFAPLALTLFLAALALRFPEVAGWHRFTPIIFSAGIIITSLALIRLYALPPSTPDDGGWLASLAAIANPITEQSHTELGMIGVSFLAWSMGLRLARHGGDYAKRRAAFIGFLTLLIVALVVTLMIATNARATLSSALAVLLPLYVFLGLLTLGQVRLAEVQHRVMTGQVDRRQSALWRLTTALLALAAILFVFLAGLIFYTHSYGQALDILSTVVGGVLLVVITIVFWVISPLFPLLANLRLFAGQSAPPCPPTPTAGGAPPATATPLPPTTTATPGPSACAQSVNITGTQSYLHIPPAVFYVFILLVALAVAVLLAYLFLRRSNGASTSDAYEEIQENLAMRAARQREAPTPAPTAASATPAPGTVRAAYRDLLRNSAAVGLARHDDETAAEFERRLAPPVTAAVTDAPPLAIEQLTTAYQDERYGAVRASPDRVGQAQTLVLAITARLAQWRKTHATLQRYREATMTASLPSRLSHGNILLVYSVILLALDPLYLTFVGNFHPPETKDVMMGLVTCLIAVVIIVLPIGAAVCAFHVLETLRARPNFVARLIAYICIFIGFSIAAPCAVVSIGFIIKGVSAIIG